MSNAETKIPNRGVWKLQTSDSPPVPVNKPTLGVFTEGDDITLNFDYSDADGDETPVANHEVELVAAQVNSSTVNTTNPFGLLNPENASTSVKFSSVAQTKLDGSGDASFTMNNTAEGHYVFFLALERGDADLTVTNGNLSTTGNVTIIGADHATVQAAPSKVSFTNKKSAAPGDRLNFTVEDNGFNGEATSHVVLVYDETTGYVNQSFTITQTGEYQTLSDLTNNTTIYHSVDHIDGVARINSTIPFEGTTPSIGKFVDFVAGQNVTKYEAAEGGDTLAASITAVPGDTKTITVQTRDSKNWTQGTTYRWVHLAVNDQGQLSSSTDTFVLDGPEESGWSVSADPVQPSEITAGDSVTVNATIKNTGTAQGEYTAKLTANGTVRQTQTVTVAADSQQQITFTETFTTPGTYEIAVSGAGAGTLTVKAKPNTGGGGGGGGGGGLEPPEPTVETKQQSDGSVRADIQNGVAGSNIRVNIPSEQATRVTGVTFDRVNVALKNDNPHFGLTINTHATRPSTVPSDPDKVAVKGYLQVEKDLISNDDIKQATIHFRLSPDQLDEQSNPQNVVLYRYHDGSWQELETTFLGKQNGQYAFKAVTPGFSTFAIGEKQPDLSVSNAELDRSEVTAGETVQVTAQVTNDGNGEGTTTVKLIVDGNVVKEKQVTVAAGETKKVTFSYKATETGEHSVAVGDVSADTLTVTEEDSSAETTTTEQPPTTDTTTTATGPGDGTSDGGSAIGIAIAILVLLGGAGGLLYYFREEVGQLINT